MMMTLVVGVSFKPLGKLYDYDASEFPDLARHEAVMVPHGMDRMNGAFAVVEHEPRRLPPTASYPKPLRPVLRRASTDDYARREQSARHQAEAHRVCKERIAALGMPMKLVETEWADDDQEVIFHFVADGRIDFRNLVRDLAQRLNAHVLMHQITARDQAKGIAAYGPCGRQTCCSTFLRSFEPVTIQMVKDQDLLLNPSRYSGLCGKLMCCLRYEHDAYQERRANLPSPGMVVMTPYGRAKVMDVNALQERLTVQLETLAFMEVKASDLGEVPGCVDHTEGGCAGGCGASAPIPARRTHGNRPLPMAE